MDSPGVVIEVPALVREAVERGPLLAACSSIVAQGDCVLSPAERDAIAIVSFRDDAGLVARIEVRLRRADGTTSITETVASFRDTDPEVERWQSLGLLVGAAVSQLQSGGGQPAPGPITTPPAVSTHAAPVHGNVRIVAAQVRRARPDDIVRARIGPSVAIDLVDATPAFGAAFDLGFRVHELVQLRGALTFLHTARAADVTVDRVSFLAGLGLRLFRSEPGFHGSTFIDAGPELVRASNATSAGDRFIGVTRVGIDLGYDVEWLTVGLTTSLQREWSKTHVSVDGARTGEAGVYAIQWAGLIGVAF